jgi:hypothetical protein
MVRKENLSFMSILIGALLAGGFLSWTTFGQAFADTNLQFAVSECPVVSNGADEESGECPSLKTIENESDNIADEQSDASATGDPIVEQKSSTRTTITSGFGNPFGP